MFLKSFKAPYSLLEVINCMEKINLPKLTYLFETMS